MTSVRGHECPRRKRLSVTSSVAISVVPPDSFPPRKSADELSDQLAELSGPKPPVANALAATSVLKYSEDDLQRILKAVLEARAPVPALALAPAYAPAPALAPIVAKAPREKLKACSLDVYRGKSHMDYYNFWQQYEDYFATTGITEPTRILFATSFLRDRISFRWQ